MINYAYTPSEERKNAPNDIDPDMPADRAGGVRRPGPRGKRRAPGTGAAGTRPDHGLPHPGTQTEEENKALIPKLGEKTCPFGPNIVFVCLFSS